MLKDKIPRCKDYLSEQGFPWGVGVRKGTKCHKGGGAFWKGDLLRAEGKH